MLPELWSPRGAEIADANGDGSAAALFDGDARTAITIAPHAQRTVRIDLGAAKQLLGLAVIGAGSAKITVQSEDDAGRQVVDGMSDGEVSLAADRWTSLTATKAPVASRLVLSWAGGGAAAQVGDVALWVAGRARDALSEASLADRLVTALPDNAVEARARPETASVTRVTPKGPQSAQLVVKLDRDPALLGRVFLVYELERLAHWTGPSRSINGHVLRGGYRANVRGLGGVQVEEISPVWLHRGDNALTFTPSQAEDGLGYVIRERPHRRRAARPGGVGGGARHANPGPLEDGSADSGLSGPGIHTAKLHASATDEPAYFAFRLDREGTGTIALSSVSADRRSARAGGDRARGPATWLAKRAARRCAARGRRDARRRPWHGRRHGAAVGGARAVAASAGGQRPDCDRVPVARRVLRPPGLRARLRSRRRLAGRRDAGRRSAGAPGRHRRRRQLRDDRARAERRARESLDGQHRRDDTRRRTRGARGPDRQVHRASQTAHCGVSPPIEDVGAPFAAVVSRREARVLSFGGATLEIPAGAVDRDVRVTIRPLPQDKLAPLGRLMTNVMPGGGAYGLAARTRVQKTGQADAGRRSRARPGRHGLRRRGDVLLRRRARQVDHARAPGGPDASRSSR
jgi:hypothetical protein